MKSSLFLLAAASLFTAVFSTAQAKVVYQDDFNLSDSEGLGETLGTGYTWSVWELNEDSVSIVSNRLRIADAGAGNDGNRLFVNHDLDSLSSYTVSFTADFSNMTGWVNSSSGLWIVPRAQSDNFPGNVGWFVRMVDPAAHKNLSVYEYSGGDRDIDGNLSGTPLISSKSSRLERDLLAHITVVVTGDSAVLTIDQTGDGGLSFTSASLDLKIDGKAIAGNGAPDYFLLGANQLSKGNRSLDVYLDDLVVTTEVP